MKPLDREAVIAARDRFFAKVRVGELPVEWYAPGGPVTACHIWTGSRDRYGYGRINLGGRMGLAHRCALILGGRELDPELEVDHLCRVRECVNPEHLDLVTRRVNWERGNSPSRINRDKTECIHGHPLTGSNVYWEGHTRHCQTCRAASNRRFAAEYKRSERVPIDGPAIVDLVASVNWLEAARLTGWPDNTLRKRAAKVAARVASAIDPRLPVDDAFGRSGLPPRMRSIFRREWRRHQEGTT